MVLSIRRQAFLSTVKAIGIAAEKCINEELYQSAVEMQRYAKLTAPWTDRTGNARRTLTGAFVSETYGMKEVYIVGRMEYSPKLELGFSGRYSVLLPTLLHLAMPSYRRVAKRLSAIGGSVHVHS